MMITFIDGFNFGLGFGASLAVLALVVTIAGEVIAYFIDKKRQRYLDDRLREMYAEDDES